MKEELSYMTINFKYKGKPMKFDVLSNVPELIEAAFINWSVRLKGSPSLLDFCNYVESKNEGCIICHPKSRKEVSA